MDEQLPASSFDFRNLYHTLLEKLWLILICLIGAAVLTGVYIHKSPRIYASTATLQVEQEEQRVVKVEKVRSEDLRGFEVLKTFEQTLSSRPVLMRVVMVNNLHTDPRFIAPDSERKSYTPEEVAAMLEKMVTVRLRRGTRLIDVTAAHTNPELTALIANSVVRQFVEETIEQNREAVQQANSFLSDEANKLKTNLANADKELQQYKLNAKAVSLEERQDIVVAKLKELGARATEAEGARIKTETDWQQVQNLGTNVAALLTINVIASDPNVQAVLANISKGETEFAALKQRYKEKHPKYIQAQTLLNEWRNALPATVLKVRDTVKTMADNSRVAEEALKAALKDQEKVAMELDGNMIQYKVLSDEVRRIRTLYDEVVKRYNDVLLTKDLQPDKITLKEPAMIGRLIKPEKKKLWIQVFFAGLFGGVLLAVGINAMDSSLKTVDAAEDYLRLPVLSAVPQVKNFQTGKHLVMAEDAKSSAAEAFRTLRTSLSMLGRPEDRRTFLFTSALPSEGKTFCSLNFSVSLAQQGLRTLIIDGDLRRPMVEHMLKGPGKHRVGVTDFLTGQKQLAEIIEPTEVENLFFIPAGTTAPNPAELLAQRGFDGLIEKALGEFDRVIVDSAPVHAVSDTLIMMDRVNTVCVVVRSGKTARKAVLRALQMLQKANAPLAGVVLNRLQRRIAGGYYYNPDHDYSYYGKYATKGVYGAEG